MTFSWVTDEYLGFNLILLQQNIPLQNGENEG